MVLSQLVIGIPFFAPQAHFPRCAQPRLKECPVSVTFASVSGDFIRETDVDNFAEN